MCSSDGAPLPLLRGCWRGAPPPPPAAARRLAGAAAPAAGAAEQHDAVAANLRGVALVAVLVVPLARLQPAFDVDLLPLGQILVERLGGLAPEHDAVPLRLLLALPRLIVPDLRRRQ